MAVEIAEVGIALQTQVILVDRGPVMVSDTSNAQGAPSMTILSASLESLWNWK